jgi:hypothetical protein
MMTTQTVMQAPTDMALLAQLDAILAEVQELRAVIQKRRSATAAIDFVAQLSGTLGPAAADEMEFFRDNNLDWERFRHRN